MNNTHTQPVPNKQEPERFFSFRGRSSLGGCFGSGFNCNGGRQGGANSGASNSGRGRESFANYQCQVCFKYGHTASVCHFQFDANYQFLPCSS